MWPVVGYLGEEFQKLVKESWSQIWIFLLNCTVCKNSRKSFSNPVNRLKTRQELAEDAFSAEANGVSRILNETGPNLHQYLMALSFAHASTGKFQEIHQSSFYELSFRLSGGKKTPNN